MGPTRKSPECVVTDPEGQSGTGQRGFLANTKSGGRRKGDHYEMKMQLCFLLSQDESEPNTNYYVSGGNH